MDNKIGKGLFWKLLERFGVQGSQFLLQLILARILDPEHYGVLSLMVIFTTLANVFIQTGFSTALVQNKDVTDEDYSSVFWVTLGIAGVLYAVIFFCAPLIAAFYEMPTIVTPLRVLALMLLPGALNAVQLAKVSREMDFRKVFVSNLSGIVLAGIVGITMALLGCGLWALVVQTVLNVTVVCLVMTFTSGLRLRLQCNLQRIKTLFSFGWKVLLSGLIDTLYQDIRSLVIGKRYTPDTLGFYNRGKQFPQFIITASNGAVQSVLLPAMARQQDDPKKLRQLTRNAISLSAYIIFPVMAGLAGVATPMVRLLLTEKWLPAVPYLQIYCFSLAFYPIHTANIQAINAMGRSDIFLKLEILKKSIGVAALVIAVWCFDSPVAIAMTGVFTALLSGFINAFPNKKLIGYSFGGQLLDIAPSFLLSCVMLAAVLGIGRLALPDLVTLVLQVICGAAVYLLGSMLLKLPPYRQLLSTLRSRKR